MDVRTVLVELGGVARFAQLRPLLDPETLARAVADGVIARPRRGIYCLPELDEQLQSAHASAGVLSHLSAAAHWGWSLKSTPKRAHVIVPRNRKVRGSRRGVVTWYRDLAPDQVVGGVTEPVRTVLDCARDLPFDTALCVADSALRSGHVTLRELEDAVELLRGPGSARARRVVQAATSEAANPLESTLRAICLGVPGLQVKAQVPIRLAELAARVDLADVDLRIVIEAEGYESHGTREGFDKDCRRYTVLTSAGFVVLRFTWTQVMFEPEWVRDRILEAVVLTTDRHNAA